jgi:hypothetical protein
MIALVERNAGNSGNDSRSDDSINTAYNQLFVLKCIAIASY